MFYWCKLRFDDNGRIKKRMMIDCCETEQELVPMLARLVRQQGRGGAEESLASFEKSQNLTGNDCERTYAYYKEDMDDSVYHLKDRQLVCAENKKFRIVDIRCWHDKILEELESGRCSASDFCPLMPKRKKRQERSHKQWSNWRWHSGIIQNYQNISEGKVRAKRASSYKSSVIYDPKWRTVENNWKEAKCRHQYEWHMDRHQDRCILLLKGK